MGKNERWMSSTTKAMGPTAMALSLGLGTVVGCIDVPPEELEDTEQVTEPITGGTLVTSTEAPFNSVVKLSLPAGLCTGSKIGARRFLTAGHCTTGLGAGNTVQITNNLTGTFGAGDNLDTYIVSRVDIHPSQVYQRPPHDYFDISVFELSVDTPDIPTLPLRTEFVPNGTEFTLVAYGCDGANSTHSGRKQQGQLHADGVGDQDYDVHNVIDTNNGNIFGCAGDSGAPLLIQGPSGIWRIGAVVSRADATGTWGARNGSINRWIAAPARNVFANGENGNFINGKSALCIGISGASHSPGGQAGQFYCDSRNQPNDNQSWRLASTGADRFSFVNRNSNLCLGVDGGSISDGALLQQFGCTPGPNNNQSWRFVQTSGDFFQIVNAKSGKCIGVDHGSFEHGVNLAQFSCSPLGAVNNQSWLFTR